MDLSPPSPPTPSPDDDPNASNLLNGYQDQASRLAEHGSSAAMLAHEINNLMTQVRGRAQLALMDPDNKQKTRQALELASRASIQIAFLCDTIFSPNPSSPPSDTLDSAVGCRINDIHTQALGFLSDEDIVRFGFTLKTSFEPGQTQLPPFLLQQVLLNLYLNAIDAIKRSDAADRGSISTTVESHAPNPMCSTWNIEHLAIAVEDNGAGMSPSQIEQITQSWQRGGSNTLHTPLPPHIHAPSGHGLGLMVCHTLISELKGTLEISSQLGTGTRMLITLPIKAQHDELSEAA